MKFVIAIKRTETIEHVQFFEVEADHPNAACDAISGDQEPIKTYKVKHDRSSTYSGPVAYAEYADESWMNRVIVNHYRRHIIEETT